MKKKSLLMISLLIGGYNAHAQMNVLNTLHNVQAAIQPSSAQPHVPSGTPAATNGDRTSTQSTSNEPTFGQIFGCDQPASHPALSAFSVHNVKLGDVCAQAELTTGSPSGMARDVTDTMRRLPQTQNIGVSQLSGGGITLILATVRGSARPAGLPKSIVMNVFEHLDAADATNSLQPGNSFRTALEQKYGKPDKTIGAREKLSVDHKAAETQVNGTAKALGLDNGEAVTKSIDYKDQLAKQWIACHPTDTIYELQWTNPDGTLLTAQLADGECGANPSFELSLRPNPTLPQESRFLWSQWIEPISTFEKAQTQARSVTAPTPKF